MQRTLKVSRLVLRDECHPDDEMGVVRGVTVGHPLCTGQGAGTNDVTATPHSSSASIRNRSTHTSRGTPVVAS